MKNWEKRFDELEEDTCGNSDKVFFPFGGDTHDFSSDNCKKFIRNLLLMQRKKIIKDLEYGLSHIKVNNISKEEIKEKIRKVGMGERWAMQAFHNGYSQAKIDILKKLNK